MYKNNSITLDELAALTNSKLIGNPQHIITGVADLEQANAQDASFYANARYEKAMHASQAGVIFVNPSASLVEGRAYLIAEDPSRAFQILIDLFHPTRAHPSGFSGIHSTAVIHETVTLGENVTIGPHVVLDENVAIGNDSFIGAGTYIGAHTTIGEKCLIHPHVTIREHCLVGHSVIIQPGAVIGACGFGYTTDAKGNHTKLNQVGNVQIEDHVEIGANTTIDRSRFKSTIVGQGTKIDNLVQLGHGVQVGQNNILVAQSGIAGSTTTAACVVIGGQSAIAGHIHLEAGVMIAGKSAVTKSLKRGKYGGIPVLPLEEYNRNQVDLRRIKKYLVQLKEMSKKIIELELRINDLNK